MVEDGLGGHGLAWLVRGVHWPLTLCLITMLYLWFIYRFECAHVIYLVFFYLLSIFVFYIEIRYSLE